MVFHTHDRCRHINNSKALIYDLFNSYGMLATVMNCIYVSEIFRTTGMKTEIFTPFACSTFTKLFSKDAANEALAQGKVVFFAGGTGHPYFFHQLMLLR